MNLTRQIKGLKTQLKNAVSDMLLKKAEYKQLQKEYEDKLAHVKTLERKIESLEKSKTITVTEHAILRYLERCCGINTKEIEQKILSKQLIEYIEEFGSKGEYTIDGVTYVVKDYNIITII